MALQFSFFFSSFMLPFSLYFFMCACFVFSVFTLKLTRIRWLMLIVVSILSFHFVHIYFVRIDKYFFCFFFFTEYIFVIRILFSNRTIVECKIRKRKNERKIVPTFFHANRIQGNEKRHALLFAYTISKIIRRLCSVYQQNRMRMNWAKRKRRKEKNIERKKKKDFICSRLFAQQMKNACNGFSFFYSCFPLFLFIFFFCFFIYLT